MELLNLSPYCFWVLKLDGFPSSFSYTSMEAETSHLDTQESKTGAFSMSILPELHCQLNQSPLSMGMYRTKPLPNQSCSPICLNFDTVENQGALEYNDHHAQQFSHVCLYMSRMLSPLNKSNWLKNIVMCVDGIVVNSYSIRFYPNILVGHKNKHSFF